MSEKDFLKSHLNNVSRSFAYSISRLDSPLREWTGLTYLICRALDTFEDSNWPSLDEQNTKFKDYVNILLDRTEANFNYMAWQKNLKFESAQFEKELINDTPELVNYLKSYRSEVKTTIAQLVEKMSFGMIEFLPVTKKGSIQSLQDLNLYCYYVAGIVGEALTRLVAIKNEMGANHAFLEEKNIARSHHFGIFLQKINILKDQFKDENEGRFFIKNRDEVLSSIHQHVRPALDYILNIPAAENGYRLFCSSAFFLGLATLPLLSLQTRSDLEPKIDRSEALELFEQIESSVSSNEKINELFKAFYHLNSNCNPNNLDSNCLELNFFESPHQS